MMQAMFNEAGVKFPCGDSSSAIRACSACQTVSQSELQPCDMWAKNGHVVMYIGNGQVIESSPTLGHSADNIYPGVQVAPLAHFPAGDYLGKRCGLN